MPVADLKVRQQALDIRDSYIVQAPAGSGKTELLIQRYLSLLAVVDEPEEVLAITFTRKAVAEMRLRVLAALSQSEQAEPTSDHARQTWRLAGRALQRSQQRGWDILKQPARLHIMTIDAFGAGLVKSMPMTIDSRSIDSAKNMPWLSEVGVGAQLASNPQYLYEEAAWQTLDSENASGEQAAQALQTLLLHLDNNDRRIVEMLCHLMAKRDQWLTHLVPLRQELAQGRDIRQQLTAEFESVVTQLLADVREHLGAANGRRLMAIAAGGAGRLYAEGVDKPHVICRDMQDLPGHRMADVGYWQALAGLFLTNAGSWRTPRGMNKNLGFPSGCTEKADYEGLYGALQDDEALLLKFNQLQTLPTTIYSEQQWQLLDALIKLLPISMGHLRLAFQRHGAMDFVEQSLAALRALEAYQQPTDLALKLDYQLKHILMDEFQDTSRSQFSLLEKLLKGWQPNDGRTLFLVGDPMQSIYRFREADVSGFLKVRDAGIADVRPKPLALTANFRSTPKLVTAFNEMFPTLMASHDDLSLGAVRYSPADSAVATEADSDIHIHAGLDRDTASEAQQLVAAVKQRLQQAPQETIAVLVRSRSHLHHIYGALLRAEIAFQAVDILPLGKTAAVQDLVSLARTLLHKHDRIAWLAVLRAPWCGATLDSLHRLCDGRRGASLWQCINDRALVESLPPEERHRLERVREVYTEVFARAGALSLRAQLEWLWHSLGGGHCHAASAADVATCLDLIDTLAQSEYGVSPLSLQQGLDSIYSSLDVASDCKVQLMTIHKSKGMQFDTVILPGLEKASRPEQKSLLAWHEELAANYEARLLLAPIHAQGGDDAGFEFVRQREKRRRDYETQRLLYVGMTRSKKHLHLFASLTSKGSGELNKPRSGTFLELLYPLIADRFSAVATGDGDAAASQTDNAEHGMLRRVAADWQPTTEARNIQWQGAVAEELELPTVEFSWAGQAARLVGTVVHEYLWLMAQNDGRQWGRKLIAAQRDAIAARLLSLGLPQDRLADAIKRVTVALTNVTKSSRGQWLLANHREASSEYMLSGLLDGRIVNRIIDRTFVDENKVRWIVDYKTSAHEGSDLQGFLDQEQSRYQAQLEAYARLMAADSDVPIKLGLYFPLVDGWREWGYG